jgi:hypothetical protein
MSSYAPARPPNERDLLQNLSGSPVFLGVLTSATSAAPVNNATTAVPFNVPSSPAVAGAQTQLKPSLAGRILLIQPTANILILPWSDATLNIALQTATPVLLPTPTVVPGILINQGERVVLTMQPTWAYLQALSTAGTSASALIWELS